MEMSYNRDLDHNYLIQKHDGVSGKEYEIRMMEQNRPDHLLPLQIRKMDGETFLYFEITGMESLTEIYRNSTISGGEMRIILQGILEVMDELRPYLLDSMNLILDPRYIYRDQKADGVHLCYVPELTQLGEDSRSMVRNLAEFLLKHLDHGERQAVDLGYALFQAVSRENVSFRDVLKELLSVKRGVTNGETEEWGNAEGDRDYRYLPGLDYDADSQESDAVSRPEEGWEGIGRSPDAEYAGLEIGAVRGRAGFHREDPDHEKGKKNRRTGAQKKRKKKKRGADSTATHRQVSKCTDKKRNGGKRPTVQAILGITGIVLAVLAGFAAIVYFGRLDLTQTSGLAFLFLAVAWLIYNGVTAAKERRKHSYEEEEFDDEEEAFLEALMSEVYGPEGSAGLREGRWDVGEASERLKEEHRENETGIRYHPRKQEVSEPYEDADGSGKTRCLTETVFRKSFRLLSMEPDQYPDLVIAKDQEVVGKKKNQADLWLDSNAVSRLHARLERDDVSLSVTDLNSMNGTFVNGERLRPGEKRSLNNGDRVSFANLHFRVREKRFDGRTNG